MNVNLIKGATQADLTNSVNNSKTYRDEAEAFSIVSEAKSVEASYSALNASISSTTASDKATIATTKANEASNSANSASASETVCIAKATIATDNANIAIAQAVISTNKATEANTSANTANTQANIAITKASEASTSAINALTSENNADTSEANALIYRNQAESFANSINPSDLVHISGTETITGNKTFSGTVNGLTKATVGLSNVDNTSDANKPISNAVQTALNTKVDKVTSTDNAVVRFNGTTGDVQNSGVIIDDNGNVGVGATSNSSRLYVEQLNAANNALTIFHNSNLQTQKIVSIVNGVNGGTEVLKIDGAGSLLLTFGTGALGYGTGAGGTVTQLTSKSTAVTLNKPTGSIMLNNSALGSGQTVGFYMYNGLSSQGDVCVVSPTTGSYNTSGICENGFIYFRITNILDIPLSEYVQVRFAIIRGVNS